MSLSRKNGFVFQKKHVCFQKNILLQRFLSLRPVAMQMAASKRFHKFWFLVLENPGFGWDFLVIIGFVLMQCFDGWEGIDIL